MTFVTRFGRRNRLPHHCKQGIFPGGAGGFACDWQSEDNFITAVKDILSSGAS